MNNKGFTLVELIVVVTIIGILIGGAALSMRSHAINARDQRRKGDLLQIKSALEFYRADQVNGNYPTRAQGLNVLSPNYVETVPTDPLDSTNYSYFPSPNGCTNTGASYCTSYQLMIAVEGNYGTGITTMTISPLSTDVTIK